MLNFQVHNLNETIKHLELIGVPLVKEKEISEFGKIKLFHSKYYNSGVAIKIFIII